jgi:tripartite-type tricarboxylate transporter receptor subunit TctC
MGRVYGNMAAAMLFSVISLWRYFTKQYLNGWGKYLMIAGIAIALCSLHVDEAHAAYPERPVKIIVPYSAGGPTDIQARIIARHLSQRSGQSFIVENRPGAGGNIGTVAVAQAAPDGYTLLLTGAAFVINPTFYPNAGYHAKNDFAPVALISVAPALLLAHPSLGAWTLAELVAAIKAQPQGVPYASSGAGLPTHLMMESFRKMAGLNLVHVPYRGSAPALVGLVAGETKLMMDSVISGMPYVRSGQLRAIAISSPRRLSIAPEVPTLDESGLDGYSATTWQGLMAPAKTAPAIINQLSSEVVKILSRPDVTQRFIELGSEPAVDTTPQSYERFLDGETSRWGAVLREIGARTAN